MGRAVWPSEARSLLARGNWKTLPLIATLFLYADVSQACLTVAPGSTPAIASEVRLEPLQEDRATTIVHAARRTSRPPREAGSHAALPDRGFGSASENAASIDLPEIPTEPLPAPASRPLGATSAPLPSAEIADAVPAHRAPSDRPIRQGEFAVLLVEMLRLRAPRGGWTAPAAASLLSTLRLRSGEAAGVVPAGGWSIERSLTEGALASLLRPLGLQVVSRTPGREITVREAELILGRLAALFRPLAPAAFTAGAAPASLALGNPRAPLSPITP